MVSPFGPMVQLPAGLLAQEKQKKRVPRTPTHDWHLRHRPYLLQPCMVAPVIPGSTLTNLRYQARVVSDPVKNPLIGWWLEYFFYYVPVRALTPYLEDGHTGTTPPGGATVARSAVEEMLLHLTSPLAAATYGADASTPTLYQYDASGESLPQVAWLQYAMDAIADIHFRDEGDAPAKVDGLNITRLMGNKWHDSLYKADELPTDTIDIPVDTLGGHLGMDELHEQYLTWQMMQGELMQEMSFEDYVQTFGVKRSGAPSLLPRIELVGYQKQWTYPTNTVSTDPTTMGKPSAAMSWSINGRHDTRRMFREPGFIIGCTVARPKVYLKAQRTYAASAMATALSWLPAIYREQVETSLIKVTTGEGPMGGAGYRENSDYVFDIRDLLLYGDQFVNFALTETDAGILVGPHSESSNVDQEHAASKYPLSTDLDGLFVSAAPLNKIRQDGAATLTIMDTQVDTTGGPVRSY